MEYTAEQVWGLAVRADCLNGGYFKEDQWDNQNEVPVLTKRANKAILKEWLRENKLPNQEEVEKGQEIRKYFNGFVLRSISGKINDFEKQALRVAQIDKFTGRNLLEFSIVSCLPSCMVRDQSRQDLIREIRFSNQINGQVGDTIVGDITVVSCYLSQDYGKYRINARMGESFVDFWYKEAMEVDQELRIKGKIKQHRKDNSTQLNYVKKA